ncbi:9534_t:CDS:1, partial [Funneliformis mosseae]
YPFGSIAFSAPYEYKENELYRTGIVKNIKNIEFKKPVDGIMYMINSTKVADFVVPKGRMKKYGNVKNLSLFIFN